MADYTPGYVAGRESLDRSRYQDAQIKDMMAAIAAQQWRQQQFEQTQAQQKMLDAAKVDAARQAQQQLTPPPQPMAPGQPSVPMQQPPQGQPPGMGGGTPALLQALLGGGMAPGGGGGAIPSPPSGGAAAMPPPGPQAAPQAGPAPGGAPPVPQGFTPIAGGQFAPPIGGPAPAGQGSAIGSPPPLPSGEGPILPPKLQTMESALKIVDKLQVPDNVKGQLLDHLAEQMDKQNKTALQKYRDDAAVQEAATRAAAEKRRELEEKRRIAMETKEIKVGGEIITERYSEKTGKPEMIARAPNAGLIRAQALGTGEGAKPPSGYRWADPEHTLLAPIKGGPADPEAVAAKKAATINIAGGRESVFVNRVVQASQQAIKDIQNIAKLPLSAQTTGILGGRHQGPGLFDAGKEVLAQKMTGQDAQTFNVIATGLQRALAQIETSGVAQGIQEFSKSIDVVAKEGETQLTKLHKMAQMRQIIDAMAEATLANERVPEGQRELVRKTQQQAHDAIPFTHSDLIDMELKQQAKPQTTLRDVLPKIKEGLAPIRINNDAEYDALPKGAQYIDPEGNQRTKK